MRKTTGLTEVLTLRKFRSREDFPSNHSSELENPNRAGEIFRDGQNLDGTRCNRVKSVKPCSILRALQGLSFSAMVLEEQKIKVVGTIVFVLGHVRDFLLLFFKKEDFRSWYYFLAIFHRMSKYSLYES